MAIQALAFSAGYITVTYEGGMRTRHSVAGMLRAADIPIGLTHSQVAEISTLANLVVVLIRTLIAREVLDESFLEDGDYNLDDITESIADMGGDYSEPNIEVPE